MNFATDSWFLAADQKSVELMSGHVRNVYNYLFSQVIRNIPIYGNIGNSYNKFALLWGEAQLWLPYVCLKK